MTRFVSAADANRQFSEILGQAAAGETIIITRRGTPVAKLLPFDGAGADDSRDAAWTRLLHTLEAGMRLGGERLDRDRLHVAEKCGLPSTPTFWSMPSTSAR